MNIKDCTILFLGFCAGAAFAMLSSLSVRRDTRNRVERAMAHTREAIDDVNENIASHTEAAKDSIRAARTAYRDRLASDAATVS